MIYLPKIYGTCKGASRSVDLSMDLAKKTKDVYMYKEILHNKDVIDYLLSSGVKYTENIIAKTLFLHNLCPIEIL